MRREADLQYNCTYLLQQFNSCKLLTYGTSYARGATSEPTFLITLETPTGGLLQSSLLFDLEDLALKFCLLFCFGLLHFPNPLFFRALLKLFFNEFKPMAKPIFGIN